MWLEPPIPTTFGNTGISVFYKINTGIRLTLLEQILNDPPKISNTGQPSLMQ